jgi:hypothetical protein
VLALLGMVAVLLVQQALLLLRLLQQRHLM